MMNNREQIYDLPLSSLLAMNARFESELSEIDNPYGKLSLFPLFIDKKQIAIFTRVVSGLSSVINKISELYLYKGLFRDVVRLPKNFIKYINDVSLPSSMVVIGRYDAFYCPEENLFKIIELNCADPSGAGIIDYVYHAQHQAGCYEMLRSSESHVYNSVSSSLVQLLVSKYKQHSIENDRKPKKNPTIAYAISRDSSVLYDFLALKKLTVKLGYNALVADPSCFELDCRNLYCNNTEVDIVYRDHINEVIPSIENEYQTNALYQALLYGTTCILNSPYAAVGDQKTIFEILSNQQYDHIYSSSEKKLLKTLIPWTRRVSSRKTDFNGSEVDLPSFIRTNKDILVLKPAYSYGGFGVMMGFETSMTLWESKLQTILSNNEEYVVQEKVPFFQRQFKLIDKNNLMDCSLNYNLGLWAHDGEYVGSMFRACASSIINKHQKAIRGSVVFI